MIHLRTTSRGAEVTSVKVGPTWTTITIRLPTDSLAAQGTRKVLGAQEGRPLRRKIRARAAERA